MNLLRKIIREELSADIPPQYKKRLQLALHDVLNYAGYYKNDREAELLKKTVDSFITSHNLGSRDDR